MTELHEDIINETGIGNIKDYTSKYKFIIPYFDIATWHDYMEENFKNIDALFNYIYEIKQYRGKWKQLTKVNVNDVYFIDDNEDPLNGRLVKVLIEHTTDNTVHFSDYYNAHQSYYEIFADASVTQIYAQEAKGYRDEAENYKNSTQSYATNAETSSQSSQSYATSANNYATDANNSAISASTYANNAQQSAIDAQNYATNLNNLYKLCPSIITDALIDNKNWINNTETVVSDNFKSIYKYEMRLGNLYRDIIVDDNWLSNHTVSGSITFSDDDALSNNFAPIVLFELTKIQTTNQLQINFIIFAKEIPVKDFTTIPTVIIYCKEK